MSLINSFNSGHSAFSFDGGKLSAKDFFTIYLLSDLHLGSSSCNEPALKWVLKQAVKENARILINGDVLDAIFPNDLRRYTPSVLTEGLQGKDNLAKAMVKYAVDFLAPYKDRIDFIGTGNHEDSALKYNYADLTEDICIGLSTTGHTVEEGQYMGFLRYKFRMGTQFHSYIIYYTHGTGGSAPVSKGIIEFNRILTDVQGVDAVWAGHLHTCIITPYTNRLSISQSDTVLNKTVYGIRTPSFYGHTKGSYPARFGYRPMPIGGVRISLRGGYKRVKNSGGKKISGVRNVECTPIIVN